VGVVAQVVIECCWVGRPPAGGMSQVGRVVVVVEGPPASTCLLNIILHACCICIYIYPGSSILCLKPNGFLVGTSSPRTREFLCSDARTLAGDGSETR
jgi:hypothetical protein